MLTVEVKLEVEESLLKERITPGGTPALRKTTEPEVLEMAVTAIVKLKLPPCKTSPPVAEGKSWKSNAGLPVVKELVPVMMVDVAAVLDKLGVEVSLEVRLEPSSVVEDDVVDSVDVVEVSIRVEEL